MLFATGNHLQIPLQLAQGMHLILLPDLRIVGASNDFLAATFLTFEQFSGRNIFDVLPAQNSIRNSNNLKHSLDRVLNDHKEDCVAVYSMDVQTPDGTIKEKSWKILNKPVLDDNDEIIYIIQQFEPPGSEMEGENGQLLQYTFEYAPYAIILFDGDGIISKWNPKAEILFAWTKDEVVGKLIYEIILPPKDRTAYKSFLKQQLSGESPVDSKSIITKVINKANIEFQVLTITRSIRSGNQFHFVLFITDSMEIRRSGQKFTSLRQTEQTVLPGHQQNEALIQRQKLEIQDFIDSMSTLCAKVATDGKLLMVNKTALQATGLRMEELLKTNFLEGNWWTYNDDVHAKVCDAFRKACAGETINYDENIFIFGQVLPINFSLIPIFGPDKLVDYIVAEGRDITSLKKTEAALQKKAFELEEANKQLESFCYSVSHDLRAPLRIIDGYTEIIASEYKDKVDEEGRRMLGIVTSNVRKMGQLIDDLLNLSRLGRKELVTYPVNMNELVQSAIADQDISKSNRQYIHLGKLDAATCDGRLIRQVWVNLISNAVKYSAMRETPVIEINSTNTGDEIVYSIKDNGVGFNMQYADKLFGVFQRLHKITEFEGTGVGLALVHRIITKHGGRVWAEAETDKGACFYFSLPIVADQPQYSPHNI